MGDGTFAGRAQSTAEHSRRPKQAPLDLRWRQFDGHFKCLADGDRLPAPVEVDALEGYDFIYESFALRGQQSFCPNSEQVGAKRIREGRGQPGTGSIGNGIELSVWE